MSNKFNNNSRFQRGTNLAEEIRADGSADLEKAENMPAKGFPEGFNFSGLTARRTNEVPGFRALSRFVRDQLYWLICKFIEIVCGKAFRVDTDYWRRIAKAIIDTDTADSVLVVDAWAGYGKSTLIKAFVLALLTLSRRDSSLRRELGGLVIVFQKDSDLNSLVNLADAHLGDTLDIVPIQGWTRSGQAEGYCKNADVHAYNECNPRKCPFASGCRLLSLQDRASGALIVCLTQKRFQMYQDTPMMDNILTRNDSDGERIPRRYVIFDENPRLNRIARLDQKLINEVSTELNQLVARGQVKDRLDRYWQHSLSYSVSSLYQQLRDTAGIEIDDSGMAPPREAAAGWVQYTPDSSDRHLTSYIALKHRVMGGGVPITPPMRELFRVMDALYEGTPCVFCRSNGFSIYVIRPPRYQFPDQLTVVFDATASLDGDYMGIERKRALPLPPKRDLSCVTFRIYTNPLMGTSKEQLLRPWKVEAFARQISDILTEKPVPTFLVTHQSTTKPLYDALRAQLSEEQMRLLVCMPGAPEQLPYFGGTNGSNAFNHCTQVILLGYPRMNPESVLTSACATFGTESILRELEAHQLRNGTLSDPLALFQLPRVGDYARRFTAARVEQDIYRTALRNHGNRTPIDVHLFCPKEQELSLILARFPGARVTKCDTAPPYFSEAKALSRRYLGGKTHYGQLEELLCSGVQFPVKVSDVKTSLHMSDNAWQDLMKDNRVHRLLEQHNIIRSGRGRNATWRREGG